MAFPKTVDYSKLEEFLKKNPAGTFSQFVAATGYDNVTDVTFYAYRKKRNGGKSPSRKPGKPTGRVSPKKGASRTSTVKGIIPGATYGTARQDYTPLARVLEANPKATYKDFIAAGLKVTMSSVSRFKTNPEKYLQSSENQEAPSVPRTKTRRMKALYYTVWQSEAKNVSPESMALLNSFIEELNSDRRAKMELIQRMNPNILEVREVSK